MTHAEHPLPPRLAQHSVNIEPKVSNHNKREQSAILTPGKVQAMNALMKAAAGLPRLLDHSNQEHPRARERAASFPPGGM
jgi:hypothetical protein